MGDNDLKLPAGPCTCTPTVAPLAEAALLSAVHVPAGSMVPSFGTYRVPYRSSTFINGYRSLVSAGDRTWDSMP